MAATTYNESLRFLVFAGNETLGREQARRDFAEQITARHTDCTELRFDASMEPFTSFYERMITPSLFGGTRIFLVPHAEELDDHDLGLLVGVLDYHLDDVYVLVEAEIIEGGKKTRVAFEKFLKTCEKAKKSAPSIISIEKFARPKEYEMAAWLMQRTPVLFGRRISKPTAERLLDLVGFDLDTVCSELQKIDIHLPAGEAVSTDAVEYITGASRAMTTFELAAAVAKKDLPRAYEIITSLFSGSVFAPQCVSAIFRQFWAMLRIREFAEANPREVASFLNNTNPSQRQERNAIGLRIGVAAGLLRPDEERKVYPVMILSGIISHARSFSKRHLQSIIELLYDFDTGIKTGRIEGDRASLELLCYRIVRCAELVAIQDRS